MPPFSASTSSFTIDGIVSTGGGSPVVPDDESSWPIVVSTSVVVVSSVVVVGDVVVGFPLVSAVVVVSVVVAVAVAVVVGDVVDELPLLLLSPVSTVSSSEMSSAHATGANTASKTRDRIEGLLRMCGGL
jgi:hypothetical protein